MSPQTAISVPSFALTQLTLLTTELASDLTETSTLLASSSPTSLQRAGLALTSLVLSSQRTGLGGKTVVELVPDPATSSGDDDLPPHGIRNGDIVIVGRQPGGSAKKREVRELEAGGCRGVVTRVGRAAVWVALDGEEGEGDGLEGRRVWVVKLANEVTYKRYVSLSISFV